MRVREWNTVSQNRNGVFVSLTSHTGVVFLLLRLHQTRSNYIKVIFLQPIEAVMTNFREDRLNVSKRKKKERT